MGAVFRRCRPDGRRSAPLNRPGHLAQAMVETIQVLRAVHIFAAIAWAGGAFYRLHVVQRILDDDRAAARFFASAPHEAFMAITATATVVFGGATMGLNSEAYSLEAIGNGAWILGLGMGAALAAFALGVLVHAPTGRRLKPLAAARAEGMEHDEAAYASLVAKETRFGRVSVSLVLVASILMLTFRWF